MTGWFEKSYERANEKEVWRLKWEGSLYHIQCVSQGSVKRAKLQWMLWLKWVILGSGPYNYGRSWQNEGLEGKLEDQRRIFIQSPRSTGVGRQVRDYREIQEAKHTQLLRLYCREESVERSVQNYSFCLATSPVNLSQVSGRPWAAGPEIGATGPPARKKSWMHSRKEQGQAGILLLLPCLYDSQSI